MADAKVGSRNVAQKGQKPYFTDFTMAPENEASLKLRKVYEREQRVLKLERMFTRGTNPIVSNQAKVRKGYPKDRVTADDHYSKRGVPHSRFSDRYKYVYKVANGVITATVYVLHFTRGWKKFA